VRPAAERLVYAVKQNVSFLERKSGKVSADTGDTASGVEHEPRDLNAVEPTAGFVARGRNGQLTFCLPRSSSAVRASSASCPGTQGQEGDRH